MYLEGMEECYILEPLVIQGFSHSVKLGISFLKRNNLKLICTEDQVVLMPVRDGSTLRARLVDGRCNSFVIGDQGKYGGQPKSRGYQPKSGGSHVRR